MTRIWLSILVMIIVTYLVRVLPLTLIRKQIKNRFFKSFLYYVPYVTLAVMTFPAMVEATGSPVSGWLAFGAGVLAAACKANLFQVASLCCIIVYICGLFL